MKKILYILSIIIIFTLLGCGARTVAPIEKPIEKTWSVVGSWEATGMKNTENFKIEDGFEYRINYETFTKDGSLVIFIDNEKGESVKMLIDVKGITKDTSPIRIEPGIYNLSQITESTTKWKATIEKR